jgi:hypothetical protein
MATYYVKRGDTGHIFEATLTADAGAVNLSGAAVKFLMRAGDGTVKVNANATVVTPTAPAVVRYTAAAGDVDTVGSYQAEWQVTYAGGQIQTFPNDSYINVLVARDIA